MHSNQHGDLILAISSPREHRTSRSPLEPQGTQYICKSYNAADTIWLIQCCWTRLMEGNAILGSRFAHLHNSCCLVSRHIGQTAQGKYPIPQPNPTNKRWSPSGGHLLVFGAYKRMHVRADVMHGYERLRWRLHYRPWADTSEVLLIWVIVVHLLLLHSEREMHALRTIATKYSRFKLEFLAYFLPRALIMYLRKRYTLNFLKTFF